jgi:transposase
MRGAFADQGGLFSYISPEARVPANHPLRKIRELVRDVLNELNRSLGGLYASEGRPSIPPEQLLSALLLQVFYGIRSERQLMEQLDYNLLYRWFVGLSPDDPVWDPTTFTKNRDRLQNGDVFTKFMTRLLNHPQVKPLLSDEHFSVDGTLIEAWLHTRAFVPRMAAVTVMTARTSTARSARTTPIPVPATPIAGFTAKPPDGRRSFAIWATPPWRTGMGWRWPAWLPTPMAPPNAEPRRSC